MRHLPRPRSTTFRIVLATALLAWAILAFGGPRAPGSMGAHAHMTAVDMSVHCSGMPQAHAHAGSHAHSAHAVPSGQGDCCHGGCHCLSACSVALLVPLAGACTTLQTGDVHARVAVLAVPIGAAPPLRPPIA